MTDRWPGAPRPVADGGESLLDAVPDPALGYGIEDGTPVVRAVNPAFRTTFDAPADLRGRPLAEVLPALNGGPDPATLARRIAAGDAVDVDLRRGTGEDAAWLRCRTRPDADGTAGVVLYTDVTDIERERRSLADRVERLEEFVGIVSHDLRNPIDVAEIRLEAALDTGEDVHVEKALSAVDRMERIIEGVRSLTLEAESVSPEPVALDEVVADAWATVDTGAATLDSEALPVVAADPGFLQQLLENLFRNAVEHGGEGVTVRVGALPDGFYVEDDGAGVPAEERDRVFEPRYTTAEDGTGLGLSIVDRIAEAHGWSASLADGEGGARFEVTGVADASLT